VSHWHQRIYFLFIFKLTTTCSWAQWLTPVILAT
jgi:hypothetical protein